MVRLVLAVAVVAAAFALLKQRSDGAGTGASVAPRVSSAQVPHEFRALLAAQPDPARLLRERGALPGLGAIRRLAGHSAEPEPAPAPPFADVGSRRELRAVRADIRRDLAALNRLSAKGGASPVAVERTLAQVYSGPVLAALGADGRRAFAARVAGQAQRVRVLDFQGVFVSGRTALAQLVYRLSTRGPSGRFVARSPQTWTVTLAREGGRWRFVQGLET